MTRSVEERWIPEETFGDRLRRVRRSLGMNQGEFAAKLGTDVGVKALGAWETGSREPRGAVAMARRIELAFGVPASWLLGLDSGTPVTPPQGPDSPSTTSRFTEYLRVA